MIAPTSRTLKFTIVGCYHVVGFYLIVRLGCGGLSCIMLTIPLSLYFIAFIIVLVNGCTGRVPLWIAVLLVTIGLMIGVYGVAR